MQSKDFHSFLYALGCNIKVTRRRHGYSQEELAELLGMHRVSIGYIEQGKQAPKLSTLHHMANLFGISVRELLPEQQADQCDMFQED